MSGSFVLCSLLSHTCTFDWLERRNMTGIAARKLCPSLQLIQVPVAHGKADLTIYREAGNKVMLAQMSSRFALCLALNAHTDAFPFPF